jgi:DNA polymerase III sliding clamp (beta) subunit (PCNA family)
MKATLNANKLSELLTGASQALATPRDAKAIPFTGTVNLALDGDTLTATGTDRFILALGEITGLDNDGKGAVNLTAATIKAIGQILKPMKDKPVTITMGHSLTIQWDSNALASSVPFVSETLDSYPRVKQILPTEFRGIDGNNSITFNPYVMAKACKVTAAKVKWQFNGPHKGAYGTALDDHGIKWQLMLMPIRP